MFAKKIIRRFIAETLQNVPLRLVEYKGTPESTALTRSSRLFPPLRPSGKKLEFDCWLDSTLPGSDADVLVYRCSFAGRKPSVSPPAGFAVRGILAVNFRANGKYRPSYCVCVAQRLTPALNTTASASMGAAGMSPGKTTVLNPARASEEQDREIAKLWYYEEKANETRASGKSEPWELKYNEQLQSMWRKGLLISGEEQEKAKEKEAEKEKAKEQEKEAEKTAVGWDEVAGLKGVQDALKQTAVLPRLHPELFGVGRPVPSNVLLYGPPGTGKSMLARVVSRELGHAAFISVSSSDILSKFIGESEKKVKELFAEARKKVKEDGKGQCVIFFDEIDGVMISRDNTSHSANFASVKTELLAQLDGVGASNKGILFIAATNRPWALDSAMTRRFQSRLYVPLPDLDARRSLLLKLAIKGTRSGVMYNLSPKDLDDVAASTEFYSGSDIASLVSQAARQPLLEAQQTHFFRRLKNKKWEPVSVADVKKMDKKDREAVHEFKNGVYGLEKNTLALRAITVEDLKKARAKIKASVSAEALEEFDKYTREFGTALDSV